MKLFKALFCKVSHKFVSIVNNPQIIFRTVDSGMGKGYSENKACRHKQGRIPILCTVHNSIVITQYTGGSVSIQKAFLDVKDGRPESE